MAGIPGIDQHVNLGVTPTWIFTPNTSGPSVLQLTNEGANTLFVGLAGVTPFNGIPIPPRSKPVRLTGITQTLYGVSNSIGASSAATLAAALPAGSTAFTTGTSIATIVAGSSVLLGSGSSAEPVSVTATGGLTTTTFTIATATLYDPGSAAPVSVATTFIGQLRVSPGVL